MRQKPLLIIAAIVLTIVVVQKFSAKPHQFSTSTLPQSSPTPTPFQYRQEINGQSFITIDNTVFFPLPVGWYAYRCNSSEISLTRNQELAANPECASEPMHEIGLTTNPTSYTTELGTNSIVKVVTNKTQVRNGYATKELTLEFLETVQGASKGERYQVFEVEVNHQFTTLLTRPSKTASPIFNQIIAGAVFK